MKYHARYWNFLSLYQNTACFKFICKVLESNMLDFNWKISTNGSNIRVSAMVALPIWNVVYLFQRKYSKCSRSHHSNVSKLYSRCHHYCFINATKFLLMLLKRPPLVELLHEQNNEAQNMMRRKWT